MRTTAICLLFALVACAFFPSMACAQAVLGMRVQGTFLIGERIVPLPGGQWTVVAAKGGGDLTRGKPLSRAFLTQLQGNTLSQWLEIDTNLEVNSGGWVRDKQICDRKDVHASYSDSNYNLNDTSCWALNHFGMTMGDNPSQAAVDFYRWSDTRGRPNTALMLGYFFTKRGDFLRVQHFFNPVLARFPDTPTAFWPGNPWHVDVAAKDPMKLQYLRSLKAIGETEFDQLKAILR